MMTSMLPAFSAASCNKCPTACCFQDRWQFSASNTPTANAITGSPSESRAESHQPLTADVFMVKKDLAAIKTMGTTTGRNALKTEGGGGISSTWISASATRAGIFLPAKLAQKWPTMAAGIATTMPAQINLPKSTPIIPAAAVAPGCGGMRQCTEYSPVAKETAIAAMEIPVRLASAEFSPLRTIYPESQKIGNPMMKPVMLMASAA